MNNVFLYKGKELEKIVKKAICKEGIAIGVTQIIKDHYLQNERLLNMRLKTTKDVMGYHLGARFNKNIVYISITDGKKDVVISIEDSKLVDEIKKYMGFGPDSDQEACCI